MAKQQYISGEQHKEMVSTGQSSRRFSGSPIVLAVIAVVLLAAGFAAGAGYQKGHQNTSQTAQTAGSNGSTAGDRQFGRFNGRRATIGKVTAVSSTSITVQDARTNSSKTFTISGTTEVSNDGATAAVSSIQVGNTVLVRANQSNTNQADRILISPGFGGDNGSSAPTTSDNSSANSGTNDQPITN